MRQHSDWDDWDDWSVSTDGSGGVGGAKSGPSFMFDVKVKADFVSRVKRFMD